MMLRIQIYPCGNPVLLCYRIICCFVNLIVEITHLVIMRCINAVDCISSSQRLGFLNSLIQSMRETACFDFDIVKSEMDNC